MSVSDRDLRRFAHDIGDHVGALCNALDHGALTRIGEYVAGVPAAAFDGSGSQGVHADPTARAALGNARDQAAQDRIELERNVLQALERVRRALNIVGRYPEASMPDRSGLGRFDDDPSCQSCARLHGPHGGPRWEPVDSRLRNPTVANGVLDVPMWLCRWCYERTQQWRRLPTADELERHHRGVRVPWPDDVERPQQG